MEQIENAVFQRRRKKHYRSKNKSLRIDMTPMVDLGFLLITFFVFTTTVSSPTVSELFMPNETPVTKPSELPDGLALTVLLSENDVAYYYNGNFTDAERNKKVFETNYSVLSGIGEVIRQKQRDVIAAGKFKEGKEGIMLLIKPLPRSTYKNVVDALDEVMINGVKKYAIVEPNEREKIFIGQIKN